MIRWRAGPRLVAVCLATICNAAACRRTGCPEIARGEFALMRSRASAADFLFDEFVFDLGTYARLRFRRGAHRSALEHGVAQESMNNASLDTVKLMTGLMATLSALVLGLLTASAKSSYDQRNKEFRQIAAEVVLLDRALAAYGPETKEVRTLLVANYKQRIDELFPGRETGLRPVRHKRAAGHRKHRDTAAHSAAAERCAACAHRARPGASQRHEAGRLATDDRAIRHHAAGADAGILISWLAAMFLGFGVVAPRNATTVVAL